MIRKRHTPWLFAAPQLQRLLWGSKSSFLFMDKGKQFRRATKKLYQPYRINYGWVYWKLDYRRFSRGKRRVPGLWDRAGKAAGRGVKVGRREDSDCNCASPLLCVDDYPLLPNHGPDGGGTVEGGAEGGVGVMKAVSSEMWERLWASFRLYPKAGLTALGAISSLYTAWWVERTWPFKNAPLKVLHHWYIYRENYYIALLSVYLHIFIEIPMHFLLSWFS